MLYRVTYDLDTGIVTNMEPVTTATIEVEDGEVYEQFVQGLCRARVVDGQVEVDNTEVLIEENVVPSAEVAEALGLEPNVGIPKAELERLAADAGISLEDSP